MTWREEYIERLQHSASSVDDLVKELGAIVGDLGFEYCSYVLRSPLPSVESKVSWSSTYPKRWLDHYFSHDYLQVDTLLQQISANSTPVAWSDTIFETEPAFWEEARAHQIRHGWAMATYGKRGSMGVLSLARSAVQVTHKELEATEGKLMWLSHAAHGVISELQHSTLDTGQAMDLTPREREAMKWTAGGKTAYEISVILGISERSVTFHIANCLTKLNATNKTQAVTLALLRGLLF